MRSQTRGKELFRTLRVACEIDCLEDRGKKISSKKNRKTSTRLYGPRQTPSGSTCATFRNACTIRASFVIGSQPMIDINLLRKRLDTVYPLRHYNTRAPFSSDHSQRTSKPDAMDVQRSREILPPLIPYIIHKTMPK